MYVNLPGILKRKGEKHFLKNHKSLENIQTGKELINQLNLYLYISKVD